MNYLEEVFYNMSARNPYLEKFKEEEEKYPITNINKKFHIEEKERGRNYSFYLSIESKEILDNFCNATGATRSKVINKLIQDYLK